MRDLKVKIKNIRKVKRNIYLLQLYSPFLAQNSLPGQFLHIYIPKSDILLRRPFSIHKIRNNDVFILFKVRGKATEMLSQRREGDPLDIIGPLGNGFNYRYLFGGGELINTRIIVLIAGGIGVAPLLFLAERLEDILRGKNLEKWIFLGARTKDEILGKKDFAKLGYKLFMATEDGSDGFKGTVIDLLKHKLKTTDSKLRAYIYASGPTQMIFYLAKVIRKFSYLKGEASFEQFMGCGVGICWGCAIETKKGYKRVCKDGPVFNLEDINVK